MQSQHDSNTKLNLHVKNLRYFLSELQVDYIAAFQQVIRARFIFSLTESKTVSIKSLHFAGCTSEIE